MTIRREIGWLLGRRPLCLLGLLAALAAARRHAGGGQAACRPPRR